MILQRLGIPKQPKSETAENENWPQTTDYLIVLQSDSLYFEIKLN